MAKRNYSDTDRKQTAALYLSFNKNVYQTSKKTGVPASTIRAWARGWEAGGFPDIVPEPPTPAENFIDKAEEVRWRMISELERKTHKATPRDLITGIGVLTDKINVARGLATSRTEVVKAEIPTAKEIAKQLMEFAKKSTALAAQRAEVIEDAQWEEVPVPEIPERV